MLDGENATLEEKHQLVEKALDLIYDLLENEEKARCRTPDPTLAMALTIIKDISIQVNPDCNGRDADMQVNALYDEFLCVMR